MLNLDSHITLDKETIESPNLVGRFSEADLNKIGEQVADNYNADCQSRDPWLRRNSAGMDLAMQIQKDKNFPWPGCSNIAFPLITIAALQFHSRAYPAIIPGSEIVNCRVIGPDKDNSKTERARRIGTYMSWQLMEQDESWEEQQDKALLNVPIVGTAFKKSYYSGDKGHNMSDLVFAKDLVINYWAKSVASCPVKTHIIPMSRNDVYTRIIQKVFKDVRTKEWYQQDAPQPTPTFESTESDNRAGITMPLPDGRTPFVFLEQHCVLDLDGDGYEEPYIVTIEEETHTVMRIVCRFDREEDIERTKDGEIIRIHGVEYFTKIPFIPSPDGGIYDIGFGVLLGPLNESTNGALNQLFDAGTMSNTAGGFLGRGAKIRGGVYNFSPFEWNRVDSTGDDLKKSIFPLPVREPSNVMFQVLSLLINYTEKISGAVDITTGGNPGQNTPAQTSQTMVEQGQKVYAAIFKRIWRSMRQEFKKLYNLNALHLPSESIQFSGESNYLSRADFLGDSSAIVPVADPNVMSDAARLVQAQALMTVGKNNPLYNQDEINLNFLRAIKVSDPNRFYLGIKNAPKPQPDVKVQVEQMKAQVQIENLKWKKLQWISSLLEQRRLNEAKIISLYAQADLAIAQAGGEKSAAQVAAFQAAIDSLQTLNDHITQQADQAQGELGNESGNQTGESGGGSGPTGGGEGTVPSMEGASGNGNANAVSSTS